MTWAMATSAAYGNHGGPHALPRPPGRRGYPVHPLLRGLAHLFALSRRFPHRHVPARWRINSYLQSRAGNRATEQADWLDPSAPSLARQLKLAGYATAHVGKWHLGGGRDVDDAPLPTAYGFDESLVNSTPLEGMGPALPAGTPRWRTTELFVDAALDFINRHPERAVLRQPLVQRDSRRPRASS